MELTQQNKTDLLEVVIILAMFFLIIVIYVPVAIWEEEEYYQDLSRYRMQNVYDIESFYSRLTGEYNPNFLEFWDWFNFLIANWYSSPPYTLAVLKYNTILLRSW